MRGEEGLGVELSHNGGFYFIFYAQEYERHRVGTESGMVGHHARIVINTNIRK